MDKTTLHYTELVSLTDGRLVAYNGIEGVYNVCNAVAGPGVTTIALTFLAEPVKKAILTRYPTLGNPEVKTAVDKALDEFKAGGGAKKPRDMSEAEREIEGKRLLAAMDKHVLPLMPEEYMELTHMGETDVQTLAEHYPDHLNKILDGKKVVVVEV